MRKHTQTTQARHDPSYRRTEHRFYAEIVI